MDKSQAEAIRSYVKMFPKERWQEALNMLTSLYRDVALSSLDASYEKRLNVICDVLRFIDESTKAVQNITASIDSKTELETKSDIELPLHQEQKTNKVNFAEEAKKILLSKQ
jgi:hypothetical protein